MIKKNVAQTPVTKREIQKVLKTKRAKTQRYWFIVAIDRQTKKVWYWDYTESEWVGRPLKECSAYDDWDEAYNCGICYGLSLSDLRTNDVYIVHDGCAEYIGIDPCDGPYPTGKYFDCQS